MKGDWAWYMFLACTAIAAVCMTSIVAYAIFFVVVQ